MSELVLRPYQTDLIKRTHESMSCGNKRPLVCLPTGGGKTAVFAWMADQTQKKGNHVWFLVHRKELLEQTEDTFDKFNIPREKIEIGMVKTVANKLDRLGTPNLIVFDEAHHATASTWQKILDRFPAAHAIGLTATPTRLDGKPLADVFDDLIIGPSTKDLIDQRYLAPYRQIISEVALGDLRKRAGEYIMADAERELMNSTVYGDVIRTYRKFADNTQAIYFCTTVKHSRATAEEFCKAGIQAEHFDAKTPKQERSEIIARFRSGETQVLTNVELIGEGFDMPACDCVGMLRPTASLTIYLQQAGRALRYREGKTAVLIDHVGNVNEHGLPSDPRPWSLTEQMKKGRPQNKDGSFPTRTCEACYTVYPSKMDCCPTCGQEYQADPRELKQINDVRMIEIEIRRREQQDANDVMKSAWAWSPQSVSEAKSFYQLAEIARIRGYKPGWAFYQARQRGMRTP